MTLDLLNQNSIGEAYSLFMLILYLLHRQPGRHSKLSTFVGICFIIQYIFFAIFVINNQNTPNIPLTLTLLIIVSSLIYFFKLDELFYKTTNNFFVPICISVQLSLTIMISLMSSRYVDSLTALQPMELMILFNLNLLYTFYGLFVLNQYNSLKANYHHISHEIGRNIETLIQHAGKGIIDLPIQSTHPTVNAVLFSDSSRHNQYHHWVNTNSIEMNPDHLGLFLYIHQQAIQNTYPKLVGKYSCESLSPNQLQFLIPKDQITTHQVDVSAVLKTLLPFGLSQGLLKEAMREAGLKPGEQTLSQDHLVQSFIPA